MPPLFLAKQVQFTVSIFAVATSRFVMTSPPADYIYQMNTARTVLSLLLLFSLSQGVSAQSGPWARFDQELKDGALYREASQGNLEEVKSIIAGGGNVHVVLKQTKSTILMAAAGSGKIEVVRYLLSLGVDPAAKDWWDQTALDKARSVGAHDVVQLLKDVLNAKQATPAEKPQAPVVKAVNQGPVKELPAKPSLHGASQWPVFGSYRVGDSILYWVPTGWRTGVIKELGVTKPTGKISVDYSERKYRIDPDAYALNDDWYDWTGVVKVARQPFWTNWFIGDWQIGEVMAHTNSVKDGTETDTYSYMDATENLRIHANGTYQWTLLNGKVKKGKWVAVLNEPGIILKGAARGLDWTLRNATTIHDMRIRKLDIIHLKPSAVVGGTQGKRKTTL